MADRSGKRKTRAQLSKHRKPDLGYYFIVTDTKETEQNYMLGLRDSIPRGLQGKLVIKVCKAKTAELVNEALNMASLQPQYGEPWIVFDRDQVNDFDQIVAIAQEKGVHAGWSNPCIEIWFSAYFGAMPVYLDSVACCEGFSRRYSVVTGQKYVKSDAGIYAKLCRFGDENHAIETAAQKHGEHKRNSNDRPSAMCPCTTLYALVKEIETKIERANNVEKV